MSERDNYIRHSRIDSMKEFIDEACSTLQNVDYLSEPAIMNGFHAEFCFLLYLPGCETPIYKAVHYRNEGACYLRQQITLAQEVER